jgi:hypothetical protein
MGGPNFCFVRRALTSLLVGYVVLALVSKAREAAGLLSCDCYPDCWCRRPGLSMFRWVFPRFHHHPAIEEWKKQQLDHPVGSIPTGNAPIAS